MLALIMAAAGSVPALAAPEGSPDLPAGLAEADWIDIRGQIEAQQTADLSTTRSSPSLGSLGAIGTQEAYLKACNTDKDDWFGYSVAVSEDTVVVGAYGEDSAATGIDGDYSDNSASGAGAVYVFIRSGGVWTQQAYLKASNTDASDRFGCSVAISGDTLVVGAFREDSAATGVGGDQSDNSAGDAGAAYVFVRSGSVWTQQAYLKASNTAGGDYFGYSVGLCDNTAVIGAYREDSAATGVDGEQSDNSATYAGAAYVFVRSGETWTQQAYLKASNTDANDWFGRSVAISGDTVMVGSSRESSAATGIDGDHSDNSATYAGAAYVFVRSGETWTQQAYLKASNTDANDEFGYSVAVSGDTALVGAVYEASSATGVNGDQSDNSAPVAGAAYVFTRTDTTWTQQAYLKASNAEAGDSFGWSVGICENTVLVSAYHEASSATGVNGDQSDNSASNAGAAYVFTRTDTVWTQLAYLKASNTGASDEFGFVVAISGNTVLAGARYEDSSATGVDGDQSDNSAGQSGAVYVLDYSGSTGIQQAYAKASNTDVEDYFGWSVAASLAPTGDTVVVGAPWEDSSATGVNGDESDNSAVDSGAAYVFVRSGGVWTQQAYLKASNTGLGYDQFGTSVAISGDTVVVGAPWEDSSATGVDGDESDDSASGAGAAYVFVRAGETWTQQAYLKASNTDEYDNFGYSVAISLDTVVVGAYGEDSATTGVDGDQSDNTAASSGAAYVFTESDGVWTQQAYLKASNTDAGDNFGYSVAISLDQLVVGAYGEASCATGVDGDQSDNTAAESGAAYIFYRPHDGSWFQEAYLKASNTEAEDYFGYSVAVSGDTVVVGAYGEDSSSTGVNGNQTDNSASGAGAAYVFALSAPAWVQQAYIKASNIEAADRFGYSVAVSGDTVLVGAYGEDSNSTGVNGDQTDNSFASSGAAYVLTRTGDVWTQQAYLKASNPSPGDDFGHSVAIAGETVVMGAREEDSSATGVNGDQADNGARNAGAAYILVFPDTPTITGLSPATGPTVGGTEVTISGTEFVGVTGVSFGSTPATSYTVDTDTQITASSPARDPGVVQVRVSAAGGSSQDTAADDFTYVAVPTVSGLDPASGPVAGGTSVTITGTEFYDVFDVTFGGISGLEFTVDSPTQITVTSPAHAAGTVQVQVITILESSPDTAADDFTYVDAPTVTDVSPQMGPVAGGTSVTITGTDFISVTDVTFGGVPADGYMVDSDTQITATSPAAGMGGYVQVQVTTAYGASADGAFDDFNYLEPPAVLGVDPTSGPTTGGTLVTIDGGGLLWTTEVTFGGTAASSFMVDGNSRILATAPAHAAGTVQVQVTTPGGSSDDTEDDDFTYVDAPTVTGLDPTSGPASGGTSVTISGTDFYDVSAITFGGTPADGYTLDSPTQITATSPAHDPGTVQVEVTTLYGSSSDTEDDDFTYEVGSTRYEQDDPHLLYTGTWETLSAPSASAGSFTRGTSIDTQLTVVFAGTEISWVARTGVGFGVGALSLDGADPVMVDLSSSLGEYQQTVWASGALEPGTHTLTITYTGDPGAFGTGTFLNLDAFDVVGELLSPTRYEEDDPALAYTGFWLTNNSPSASEGTFTRGLSLNSQARITFQGTSISWVAKTGVGFGLAQVQVDNQEPRLVDLSGTMNKYTQTVWASGPLEDGTHTLTITHTGTTGAYGSSTYLCIDALDVVGTLVTPTRYEQDDPALAYVGFWLSPTTTGASGGTFARGLTSDAQVRVAFEGTSISLLAKTAPGFGLARVEIDGAEPQLIDLSSTISKHQQTVWASGPLEEGTHILTLSYTDLLGADSTAARIDLDAVEVVGTLITPTRHEQDDPALIYSGVWPTQSASGASGGSLTRGISAGAQVEFSFTGTGVAWVARTGSAFGVAEVSVDGGEAVLIDLSSATTLEQQTVWMSGPLSDETHTVTITSAGAAGAEGTGTYIDLDALDVVGVMLVP